MKFHRFDAVAHFWAEHFATARERIKDASTHIVSYEHLEDDEYLMVLRKEHGGVLVTAWPHIAAKIEAALAQPSPQYIQIMAAIEKAGFRMHGEDNVFHLPNDYQP